MICECPHAVGVIGKCICRLSFAGVNLQCCLVTRFAGRKIAGKCFRLKVALSFAGWRLVVRERSRQRRFGSVRFGAAFAIPARAGVSSANCSELSEFSI